MGEWGIKGFLLQAWPFKVLRGNRGGRESKGSLPLAWPSKGLRGAMGR